MINAQKYAVRRSHITAELVLRKQKIAHISADALRHKGQDLIGCRRVHIDAVGSWNQKIGSDFLVRPEKQCAIRKAVGAVLSELARSVISTPNRRYLRQRLRILTWRPPEIARGQSGLHQIHRSRKLAVEVQQGRPAMRLQRSNHVHGVARRKRESVHGQRNWTACREVRIGSIARASDSLKFGDEVTGSAIHRLPGEWTRKSSAGRRDLLHNRISHSQRLVHSGHMRSEILREARIEK